jgi:hypothetical protein
MVNISYFIIIVLITGSWPFAPHPTFIHFESKNEGRRDIKGILRRNEAEGLKLSRIINPESAGKERGRLSKAVVLAVRELMKQTEANEQMRDLAAFIALALEEIAESIEPSLEAWEKRGYWVKADHFRLEWEWCGRLGSKMREATLAENWADVAQLSVQAAQKLGNVKVAKNHRMGTPWVGAWAKINEMGNRQ